METGRYEVIVSFFVESKDKKEAEETITDLIELSPLSTNYHVIEILEHD